MKRGSAHVKGTYTVPNGSGTQFVDGAQKVWDLGLRVLKVYCTADYLTDYPLQVSWSSSPANVKALAQTTQFSSVLGMNWDTVIMTVFTFANGSTNWWRINESNAALQNEYNEIKDLAEYLLTTYNGTGRKFIIQQWEGDWAFMDSFDPATKIDRKLVDFYEAFLAIRQKAVSDARKNVPSDVQVLNCIEVNRVLDASKGRRRIINSIAKRVKPDIVGYSCYDSTIVDQGGWGASLDAWTAATVPAFSSALTKIQAAFPGIPVMVSEFGFPELEAPVGRNVGDMIQVINDVCLDFEVSYLVYWEAFDNEGRGFYLVKSDGSLSDAGTKMQALGP